MNDTCKRGIAWSQSCMSFLRECPFQVAPSLSQERINGANHKPSANVFKFIDFSILAKVASVNICNKLYDLTLIQQVFGVCEVAPSSTC